MHRAIRSRASRAVAAAGNYTAGDIVSDSASNGVGTAWEFTQMAPGSGFPGIIYKADITCDEDSVTASYRLHLFSASPSTATELDDNAAKTFDNDDRANYLGAITFPAMVDEGEMSRAQIEGLTFGYWCGQSGTSLYGVLEDLSGETNETAGMTITMTLWAVAA